MAPPKPSRSKKRVEAGTSPAAALLHEAERLKQQAERKSEGVAREPLLIQCVKLLQQALASPLSPPQEDEALFDLGEVYALLGSTLQAKMYQTLGSIFNGNLHRERALNIQSNALKQCVDYYRTSHEMYEKVVARNSNVLKQEALINGGNSLCEWAELLPPSAASSLFEQADLWYEAALVASPDDVDVLTNSADCKVRRAEMENLNGSHTARSETWLSAKDLYSKAMVAYGRACSLADARVGDDLAGLLQNWGASLSSVAERTPDEQEAECVHEQALEKLRNAAKFRPTDVSVFVAIGEAFCTRAERIGQVQSLELLATAIDEGFSSALRIDASCLDAVIGKAEAHLAAGKCVRSADTGSISEDHFTKSLDAYMSVLQILKADVENSCKLKFEEQCSVLFNLACSAALCNQESVLAEALTLLVQVSGVSTSDLTEDPDLQTFRTKDWFLALVQTISS